MLKSVPVILSLAVLCGLLASTSSAEIDLSKLDASLFREHDLFDIAHEFAVQFPEEVREMLRQLSHAVYGEKSLGDEMFEQLTSPVPLARNISRCLICTGALTALGGVSDDQDRYDRLLATVISGCEFIIEAINTRLNQLPITRVDFKAGPLCRGAVGLQGPQIRNVFLKGGLVPVTASRMCDNLNQCISPAALTASSRGTRSISSSPRVSAEQVADDQLVENTNKQQSLILNKEDYITIAQLTDIHIEPDYAIGSPKDCGLPVCCIEKWRGDGQGQARPFGEYSCNIPQRTINQFLAKVDKMNPDIVLFTGDIPPHTVWEETEESQYNCTALLTESIKKMIPGRKVYPCIGNHETYPTNMFSVDKLEYTPNFLTTFSNSWKDIAGFSDAQLLTVKSGGFYTAQIMSGLRLIAFNSDYMYTLNWYNALNNFASGLRPPPTELSRTQTFLRNQLRDAKANNQKVILMCHHPIGGSDSIVIQSRWYQSLVIEYSDIIVLQPTGHTHYDEIRMIYNSTGSPVSVVLVSPSITSYDTRNPSMRLYYLNKTDFSLVDYEQYFYSLGNSFYNVQADDAQNNAQTEEAADNIDITDAITLLYSAKSAYQMPDLSPKSWDELTDRFATDRNLLFRSLQYSDAAAKSRYICRPKCQHDYICRQRNADYDLYKECKDSYVDDRNSTQLPPEQGTEDWVTNVSSDEDTTETVTDKPADQDTQTEGTSGSRGLSCCNNVLTFFLITLCVMLRSM